MTSNVEQRLRQALATVAEGVETEREWDRVVADAESPPPNRRTTARRRSTLAIAAVLVVAVGVGGALLATGDDDTTTVADRPDFVLSGEVVLDEDPLIVVPAAAPEPAFDTGELGVEVVFEQIARVDDEITALVAQWDDRLRGPDYSAEITKVTLAGRIDAQPWLVIVADGPNTPGIRGADAGANLRQRFVVSSDGGGGGSGDLVAVESLDMIELPASSTPELGFGAPTGWLTWSALPAATAAVSFADSDQKLWMQPRARMAVFDVQFDNGERFVLKAYDAAGNVIGGYSETVSYDTAGNSDIEVGDRLGTIRGVDQNGEPVRIGADGRLTALVFGADWCQPCEEGIGTLRRRVEALDPTAMIYSVPHYSDQPWPAGADWPHPQLTPEDGSMLRSVAGIPAVLVLDGDNEVLLFEVGFDASSLAALDDLGLRLTAMREIDQATRATCQELLQRREQLAEGRQLTQAQVAQAQAQLDDATGQSLPTQQIESAETILELAQSRLSVFDQLLAEVGTDIERVGC